jgi:hypothetical protein
VKTIHLNKNKKDRPLMQMDNSRAKKLPKTKFHSPHLLDYRKRWQNLLERHDYV